MAGMRAQGATEYLVLLAVVLIVALVSVALLGFFPGMASDAQLTQSQMYWKSTQPISIVESGARFWVGGSGVYPYLRIRNTGAYPITVTGIVGADGIKAPQFRGGYGTCGTPAGLATYNISDYFYMAPGEEKYFAWSGGYGVTCNWWIIASAGGSSSMYVGGASSLCQNSATPGVLQYNNFGFEYVEYIDGQQITKRQIGKALIVKCMEPG